MLQFSGLNAAAKGDPGSPCCWNCPCSGNVCCDDYSPASRAYAAVRRAFSRPQNKRLGDAYSDCLVQNPGDVRFCEVYTSSNDGGLPTPSEACHCDANTQWCDGGRCIPFTYAEQMEWMAAGKPPDKIVTSPKPPSGSFFSGKMLLALAGAIGLGVLIYKQR